MEDFLSQAHEAIPNFLGVKFSSYDTVDMRRSVLAKGGKYQIIDGRDDVSRQLQLLEILISSS